MSILASDYYDNPSQKLKMIGVTGTDGKTTTANLIYWILKKSEKRVGIISTVSAKIRSRGFDTGFHVTNPEAIPLQNFLAKMVKEKCEYCVLEVTSHGLDQERVYGVNFDISVLTNITHEHLDYHKTYSNYIKAKEKLFKSSKISVLNRDYAQFIRTNGKRILYDNKSLTGILRKSILNKFKEQYNLLNSTAAILTAKEIRIKDIDIINAIKTFPGVPGRMEEVKNNRGVRVIIDFAHTPNSLENMLTSLASKKEKGKLIAVLGCAGERDKGKRKMMGRISTRIADISIFTAEDPRGEDINKITSEIVIGAERNKKGNKYFLEKDRGRAISFAINDIARKGDIVVVSGKGHEKSMNYNGIEYPWSDLKAVQLALDNKYLKIDFRYED